VEISVSTSAMENVYGVMSGVTFHASHLHAWLS
jgi:hypothetical protein